MTTQIQQFDYSVNLIQALLWQYENTTALYNLIGQKQLWYDENQSQFWEDWYTNVFDLRTANLFGLAVWSIILGVPLFVPLNPDPVGKPIWGFNAYDPSFPTLENTYFNFGNGNFSNKAPAIVLTLEEQRFLLRMRYFQLTTRGAIPEINQFLNYLISTSAIDPIGPMWALDGLNMTMRYIFGFNISLNLLAALRYSADPAELGYDVLPRPATVGTEFLVNNGTTWGFGMFNQNFENGNFISFL